MRTFVDRGGTFTDVVTIGDDGELSIDKVPSDVAVVGDLARGSLTFGTTVATNALLEGQGVATTLYVTEGLGDLATIGDQTRPALFDPDACWPAPISSRVVEVRGRIDADGAEIEPVVPPDDPASAQAAAVVLVNSHRNPAHERAVAEGLDVDHVSLGHEVSPELGYLARIETTLVDAAITPVLQRSMLADRIPPSALAVRSDGSVCPAGELRAPDAVLSGPAGGVIAVAAIARQAGFSSAVGLDMGGTSTDVCRVDVAQLPRVEGDARVAGARVRRPILEVETIAAGGGSILGNDGLRLTVGPRSAGADPGPACYGRGGPQTLTDAALVSGLVDASRFPIALDPAAVTLSADEAEAYLRIAREAMAQAIRKIATKRGIGLDDHALVSYGGAAGQHAAAVAELLGIRTVLVHPCASVLCAWGQSLARREETAVTPIWRELDAGLPLARQTLTQLARSLPQLGETQLSLELRHSGTDHPLSLALRADDTAESLRLRFYAEHGRRFGFSRPGHAIEIVNARARTMAPAREAERVETDPWGIGPQRVHGPTRLSSATTALWVPKGWSARRRDGLLWLEVDAITRPAASTVRTPERVELWGNRFRAVADDAGTVLGRLARSVNIRERKDYSCAVFDGAGRLVANAPHIPVHLGAMGETVRDLLRHHPDPAPGQAWLCNDPAAGGSHLPDLTVTTAVEAEGVRFFVASRGHHVDVGGLTPGSMPPSSRTLADEGFVVRHRPLLGADRRLLALDDLLAMSRQPATVRADLEAQIAANAHAARALVDLGPARVIDAWMGHLRDVAAEAVGRVLTSVRWGRASDLIDGVPVELSLRVEDGRLVVDFSGTGGPHPGNLNAPGAVVRAAVLYCLRVLSSQPIPLNEGAFDKVDIVVPGGSILAPPPSAAVVGGNVETSQRIVDLFLQAAGARAASAGTMNNLVLGGPSWSLYETIGGGCGASADHGGQSGVQLHMTNTRATDVEVLEARMPLRVRRFALRADSGGTGRRRGGDGLIRELEVTTPATATLLAAWRPGGAPGSHGGAPGAAGRAEVFDGKWRPWDGHALSVPAGGRVRVYTPGGGGWGLDAEGGA